MKSISDNILFYILLSVVYTLSLLPLCVLYILSDVMYILVYKILGYRKRLVRKNLRESFPERSQQELTRIEKDFYHWFCDYIVETIKMFSMSEKEMRRRMVFENLEEVNVTLQNHRSASVLLGHYCNWEWVSSLQLHLKHDGKASQIYHQLESKAMDRLLLHSRGRFGSTSIEMKECFARLLAAKRQGECHITGYISDQIPGFSGMHFWTTFLNHPKTPCFSGAERIARLLDTDCYYMDVSRPRRGYYVARFVKITESPASTPRFYVTETYFRHLEESIRTAPHLWLWTHNRWKRTWEDFCQIYPDETKRNTILKKL